MPRKSSASGDVIRVYKPGERPAPPDGLTAEQAVEWRKMVAAMPPGHFDDSTFPMLAELCRDIVSARRYGVWLDAHDATVIKNEVALREFKFIARQRQIHSANVERLCTRLRIGHQARFHRTSQNANTHGDKPTSEGAQIRKPWERRTDA